jgi:hypothetical protein
MATAARAPFMSVKEYLRTTFRPDVYYIEGKIEEHNSGQMDHGTLQRVIFVNRREWKVWPALHTPVQVPAPRSCVPDVAVVSQEKSRSEQFSTTPPLV